MKELNTVTVDVERLLRENDALRRLLVPDGECEHQWNLVTYDYRQEPNGFSFGIEDECMKCLRRRPLS